MAFNPFDNDQQPLIVFDNEANFALLDTDPGAENGNGLYEQLMYVLDGLPTGWNYFNPFTGENHNDWAAGGVGSDTLIGDTFGDLSCEAFNEKGLDAESTISNDILYGGSGFFLDFDYEVQSYIDGRPPIADDGDDSTPPPFDTFDFGTFDINAFDLDSFDLGVAPRYDYAGDSLVGGMGNDTLFGQFGDDTLEGGSGSDWMFGGRNRDLMDGDYLDEQSMDCGTGDRGDVMFGERGKDTMFGGDDSVTRNPITSVFDTFLSSDQDEVCSDIFGVWNWDGDWMKGGRGRDEMYGEGGFDTMYGNQCADTMHGGDHYDLMYGGRGSDYMLGGTEASDGGGIDTGDFSNPMWLIDPDCDRCAYEGNYTRETIPLQHRGGDTMYGGRGYDTMYGGRGDDLMFGGDQGDSMYGGDDDDRMLGQNGGDYMIGGEGWDDMSGGRGGDYMEGNDGDDYMDGDDGNDTMAGGDGQDVMHGGEDDDTMSGGNQDDTMYGEDGMDYMMGDNGNDAMWGQGDMDVMFGGDGADCMQGGDGRDFMHGNADNDIIDGGAGQDTMIGGDGSDIIYISGGTSTKYEIAVGAEPAVVDIDLPGDGGYWNDNTSYDNIIPDGATDTFVYEFTYDMETHTANGDSGYVAIADFNADEDILQLCFNDPIDVCCDDVDTDELSFNDWSNVNSMMARSLSQPDIDGQHAVRVVDDGEDTLIIFDDTEYSNGQEANDPDAEDASDPTTGLDEVIWLVGVTGGDRPFATLNDMIDAGYDIRLYNGDNEGWEGLTDGIEYSQYYVSCESTCPTCDIDPFAEIDNGPGTGGETDPV